MNSQSLLSCFNTENKIPVMEWIITVRSQIEKITAQLKSIAALFKSGSVQTKLIRAAIAEECTHSKSERTLLKVKRIQIELVVAHFKLKRAAIDLKRTASAKIKALITHTTARPPPLVKMKTARIQAKTHY